MRAKQLLLGSLVAVAGVAYTSPAALAADADDKRHCFFSNQFNNWKAGDEKTLYVRVGVSRYFRLDLVDGCRAAMRPNAYLITMFRGTSAICSAIDWDLKVAQSPSNIAEGCIVSKMTELTADEVSALPKGAKP